MSLPQLTFSKSWTAPASQSGRYLPTIEPSEEQAREDLQVQHDDTAAWALALVTALGLAENLGVNDNYSAIGEGVANVKSALLSLKTQLDSISQGAIPDYSLAKAKLTRTTDAAGAAVGTENIENGAVTTAKLSVQDTQAGTLAAVNTDNIRDGAVTHDKLATGTGANAPVGPENMQENAVKTRHITDGQITTAKLSSTSDSTGAAVGTNNIKDANVTHAKMAADAIETDNIVDANITHAKMAANAIENDNIKDGEVDNDKLDATCVKSVNGNVNAVVVHLMKTGTSSAFEAEATPTLTDYPYRASVTDSDVTVNDKVYVEFDATQIGEGVYAPMTTSYAGGFYIYAEESHVALNSVSYTIFKKGTQT